jgi:endonuclease III
VNQKQKKALKIYEEITKLFPNACCELNYQKDYELLIAIVLSAQTTDQAVNKVTNKLFNKYHSLDDFANTTNEELENDIRNLGLFRNKAKNIVSCCNMINNLFKGKIPNNQKDLESLPGVGRKTANVYLSELHHIPRIAVDTHVSRVSIRLGWAKIKDNPQIIEKKLMNLFPESYWISLHHTLIFFGRYHCTARSPKCKECPILEDCKMPVI